MLEQAMSQEKLYLYAIARAFNGHILGAFGLDGSTVYSMTHGGVSAIVSDVPEKLRPERRHLAAHQEVLKRLMAETTAVLPVGFGVVAERAEAIHAVLCDNHRALVGQLLRVEGRIEMGLRVTWDVPNIFEYFVETHPDLRVARDRFLTGRRAPSQDDKIEVGRLFDNLLVEDRDAHAARVEEVIAPQCVEIKRTKPRNEREAVNLACLVARDRAAAFETAVFEAAKLFDNNYAFDYNGPWAPHNFVELALDLQPARAPARTRMPRTVEPGAHRRDVG